MINIKQRMQLLCALSAYAVIHCRAFLCTPAKAIKYSVDEALADHEATALVSLATERFDAHAAVHTWPREPCGPLPASHSQY
jgi:hypothetical protein